jgi:hypothetical protein
MLLCVFSPAVTELTSGEQLRKVQRDRTVFFLLVTSTQDNDLSVHLKVRIYMINHWCVFTLSIVFYSKYCMSGKLTALTYSTDLQHRHSITCRNIGMAPCCFRVSHPITTYSYGYGKIQYGYSTAMNLMYFFPLI